MKFSYNWLKEYVAKIHSPQRTAESLSMGIFEVENVEQYGKDWILDIKILPNRAHDCFSHLGVAREIAAVSDERFVEPVIKVNEDKTLKIKDFLNVEVKNKKLCPRYSARVLFGVNVGNSPQWLQERLISCGLRPINNIVDITNYVMLECGQPLHAFDLDKVESANPKSLPIGQTSEVENLKEKPNSKKQIKKIIVRPARKGEKIITLDEGRAERMLSENILVIADEKKAIGIAGIKGGRGPEIDSETKRIALEAANFEPRNIRQSSRLLGLRTDASLRFENSPDINLTTWALDRAAALMQELAGAKVIGGTIDIVLRLQKPWSVVLAHDYLESLLGVVVSPKKVLNIFARLGLPVKQIKKSKGLFYELKIPTRRSDLQTSEDLIEEVGRLFGYQNIPAKLPGGTLIPALESEELVYRAEISDILAGLGYGEVYNYSFVSEADKEFYNLSGLVELNNPLSQEQKYFRPNLAVGLIKNLQENLKYLTGSGSGFVLDALRLFEIGHVFSQTAGKITEDIKIGGLVYLKNNQNKNQAFYELKGVIETLFNKLGLVGVWSDDYLQEGLPANWQRFLHGQKSAQIKVGQEIFGWLGEANPLILDKLSAESQLAALELGRSGSAIFEIDFSALLKLINKEKTYQPFSKFPAITRDLALLVGPGEKTETVLNVIERVGGEILADVDLFDIFEGEDLGAPRKSLAFHLIWQSLERNLSDAEVNKFMEKIIAAAEDQGWEVRK